MVISIFKFMSGYYGVPLNAGVNYSHAILKKTFKFLKRCSFKYADDNPELVGDGKIIYVKDSYNIICPYICPKEIVVAKDKCEYTCIPDETLEYDVGILDKLCEMSTYQVRELLSRYKDKPSFYKLIKRELINRGVYQNKIHKLGKEIMRLEESECNDKYKRRRKIKCKES